jgi:hypothetical protein
MIRRPPFAAQASCLQPATKSKAFWISNIARSGSALTGQSLKFNAQTGIPVFSEQSNIRRN